MKYGLLIQLFLFFHISLSLNATTAQVYDIKKANDLYVIRRMHKPLRYTKK